MAVLFLPTVGAITYEQTLPSNTIFFDDFEGAIVTSHSVDTCASGKVALNSTYAYPGSSKSLLIQCPTASSIQDAHWAFSVGDATRNIRVQWRFFPTKAMNQTASSGDISFSNEAWNPNQHWEGKLIYTARVCTWKLFYGNAGANFLLEDLCVPVDVQNVVVNTQHISQTWSRVSMTVDWITQKYTEVCTPDHCFSPAELEQKQNGGSVIRSISAAGASWDSPYTFHSVELSVDVGAVASSGNYGAHFDNMLVTDETQGPGTFFAGFGGLGLAWVVVFLIAPIFYMIAKHTRRSKDELKELRETIRKGPEG